MIQFFLFKDINYKTQPLPLPPSIIIYLNIKSFSDARVRARMCARVLIYNSDKNNVTN